MTPEQAFNEARQRVLAGEKLSLEEQAKLVELLRAGRYTAAEAGSGARAKKTTTRQSKVGMSDDELDASLGDLGL